MAVSQIIDGEPCAMMFYNSRVYPIPERLLCERKKPLRDEQLPWKLRIKIALDIARGMSYLQSLVPPIVHRDLRSPNIFMVSLDPNAIVNAKVADFGLAQIVEHSVGGGLGTFQWLAPEIIDNQSLPIYDERSDVYSFAMVLYEICSRGIPYFQDYWERFCERSGRFDEMACIKAIVHEGLRPIIPADTPPELARLMRLCWAGDVELRPKFDVITRHLCELLEKYDPDNVALAATKRRNFLSRPLVKKHIRAIQAAAMGENMKVARLEKRSKYRLHRSGVINLDDEHKWSLAMISVTRFKELKSLANAKLKALQVLPDLSTDVPSSSPLREHRSRIETRYQPAWAADLQHCVPEDEIWISLASRKIMVWNSLRNELVTTLSNTIHQRRKIYNIFSITRFGVVCSLDELGGLMFWSVAHKEALGFVELLSETQRSHWTILCALDVTEHRAVLETQGDEHLHKRQSVSQADWVVQRASSTSTDDASSKPKVRVNVKRSGSFLSQRGSLSTLPSPPSPSGGKTGLTIGHRKSAHVSTSDTTPVASASSQLSSTITSLERKNTEQIIESRRHMAAPGKKEAEIWICDSSGTVIVYVCMFNKFPSSCRSNSMDAPELRTQLKAIKRIQLQAPGTCMCSVLTAHMDIASTTSAHATHFKNATVWVGSEGMITRIDMHSLAIKDSWEAHEGRLIRKLLVLQDNNEVWSCGDDGKIAVWGMVGGELKKILSHHITAISCMEALHQGQRVCSGSVDSMMVLWDSETHRPLQTITSSDQAHLGALRTMAMSNNADLLWTGGGDYRLCLWRGEAESNAETDTISTLPSFSGLLEQDDTTEQFDVVDRTKSSVEIVERIRENPDVNLEKLIFDDDSD